MDKVQSLEKSKKQSMENDLCGIPLTSSHFTKYTSLQHYCTNNTCIHTNTSTGICLSTEKQNNTHATKSHISTLVWRKHRFLRDVKLIYIWTHYKHTVIPD